MEKEAVREIAALAEKGFLIEKGDDLYTPLSVNRVYSDPRPATLALNTLSGLVDYVEGNIDKLRINNHFIHIVDHNRVCLLSNIHGESVKRDIILDVQNDYTEFPFGRFIGAEEFIIGVRSRFVPNEGTEYLLRMTGKLDVERGISVADDGITQGVTVKQGISGSLRGEESVKNIVALMPYRTFIEVEQPECRFLFRLRTNGDSAECMLTEADGGMWKVTAKDYIRQWIREKLPEMLIVS